MTANQFVVLHTKSVYKIRQINKNKEIVKRKRMKSSRRQTSAKQAAKALLAKVPAKEMSDLELPATMASVS